MADKHSDEEDNADSAKSSSSSGIELVEVFSVNVFVNSNSNRNMCNVYGTICIDDPITFGKVLQCIYHHPREESDSVSNGDQLTLTGPARPIFGYHDFIIKVDLYHNEFDECLDKEIASDRLYWSVVLDRDNFNQYRSKQLDGEHGQVIINYAVFQVARAASVQIWLINGDDENAEIHGRVTAETSKFPGKKIMLLDSPYRPVRLQKRLVPLSRFVVVVPVRYELTIQALLGVYCDHHPPEDVSEGETEVTLKFKCEDVGKTSVGEFDCRNGQFKVIIEWEIWEI